MKGPIRGIGGVALLLTTAQPAWSQTFFKMPSGGNPILADQSTGYSGAAWIDMNGDGNLDLFVNNSFLYRGNGSGSFSKVVTAIGSGIVPATGNGVTWGDYDNDGDLDVYIASRMSALYSNNGSGVFTLVTTGDIGQTLDNRGWSPAWGDFNADGNLDLAVTHPAGFVPGGGPTTNHLFVNDGPPGYGLTRVTVGPIVTGLDSYTVGSWSDFDGDRDLDYFIGAGPANGTTQPDFLYRNLLVETGTADFELVTEAPIATEPQDGQLWNWIDYDNDGDLDAYLTNWGVAPGLENRLYRNDGAGFTKITTGAIVTDSDTSLSSVWGDFDNDGDLDCFVANDFGQSDRYYSNNGDGTFTSLTNALTESLTHRGAAAGDFDNDGDLDLYVDGPGAGGRSLFRNDTANGNHWLKVSLAGIDSNASGIGAKVRATAVIDGATVTQLREVSAQNTFNGHNSLIVHFGLGDAALVESLVIEWPSGNVQTLTSPAADQLLAVTEDTTTPSVPDGAFVPGMQLMADKSGGDVLVTWDVTTCPPVAVNVYHGALGAFSAFTGATCGLPPTGSATVAIPDGSWFLVAATDGLDTDGSHGADSSGMERDIAGVASVCPAITQHAVNSSCP